MIRTTLAIALTLVISCSYAALNSQQIFLMQTQTGILNNNGGNNHSTQPANTQAVGRSAPNTQTYQVTNANGQVVGSFQTNNPRAAESARQSFCDRIDNGFSSPQACLAAQRTNDVQVQKNPVVKYPVQHYKPVIYQRPSYGNARH